MGDDLAATGTVARALAIAEAEPQEALALADEALIRWLADEGKTPAAARGWWARGLAHRKLGQHQGAFSALSRAHALFEAAGEPSNAHRVAIPLAFEHLLRGGVAQAITDLEAAAESLDGLEGATAKVQLALVLHRAGRDADTMLAWDQALVAFRAAGSLENEAKVLANRAVIYAERGGFDAAEADIAGASSIYELLGDRVHLAVLAHNRGYVAARRGDLASALRYFDDSQRSMSALGVQKPELLMDRADTLAAAGLFREARAVIESAVRVLEELGQEADLAEAYLSAARACLAIGNETAASGWARRAETAFVDQGRTRWVPIAAYYAAVSTPAGSEGERAEKLLELSATLRASGWRSIGDEADEAAVDLLIRAGRLDDVAIPLARLRRLQRGAPHVDRLRAWMAETRFRAAKGRNLSAARAMDAAVAALLAHQAGIGSMELRAYGAGRGERVIALAVSLGRAIDSPGRALGWVERIRSGQDPRPVETDPRLAGDLEELRRVTVQLRAQPLSSVEERRLRAQGVVLEELVRRRARHASDQDDPLPEPKGRAMAELGDRTLVEYVVGEEGFGAIVAQRRRSRFVDLGTTEQVRGAVEGLRLLLASLVSGSRPLRRGGGDTPGGDSQLDEMLGEVADLLVTPLELELSPGEVVIVPGGPVASVPWGALPGLARRLVLVAPSASAWRQAARRRMGARSDGRSPSVVIVVGPGLRHSDREAAEIARIWGSHARVLSGDDATVPAALEALGSADLAHFAAHGAFRSDAPMLSGLHLSDGPITGYDLSRLARAPSTVILSCCETGMTGSSGEGTLGVSGLLLASGAASIVASVAPVADEAAPGLAVALHRSIRQGESPAAAVLSARSGSAISDVSGLGFCCFGA